MINSWTCFSTKEAQPEEDPSVSARLQRLQNNYEDFGMRRTVEGILVVHDHGHPHILMLQIANAFFKLYVSTLLHACAVIARAWSSRHCACRLRMPRYTTSTRLSYVTREPLALFHTDCTALTRIELIALQPIRVTAVQSVCDSAWTDPQRFCACSASSPLRLIWLMTTMLWIAIRHPYGRPCSERTLIPYPQPRGLSQAR